MLKSTCKALFTMVTLIGAFALAGCGDDTTSDIDMSKSADLSVSGTTCGTLATCILGAGGVITAIDKCIAAGSASAMTKYKALQTCGFTACSTATDAGAAKCTSATDTSAGCVSCQTAMAQGAACSTQLSACFADK